MESAIDFLKENNMYEEFEELLQKERGITPQEFFENQLLAGWTIGESLEVAFNWDDAKEPNSWAKLSLLADGLDVDGEDE